MRRTLRRLLIFTLLVFGICVAGITAWIGPMLYSALVGFSRYETVPPSLPAALGDRAVLIFSKTNGFRDDKQINAANAALIEIARRHGWGYFATENAAVFDPRILSRFKAVVWNSVSGDVLTVAQRAAFKAWLERGGGFVGLHGAGGDPRYKWRWYVDDLIGAQFIGHTLGPHIQQAKLVVEDPSHPAMRGLGPIWVRSDEWYSFASDPRAKGYHILLTIDEASYRPVEQLLPFLTPKDIRMGKDHPLVWTHCVGNGRAFYSALGHAPSSYSEPKHVQMIAGAIAWAIGGVGPMCARR